MLAFCDSILNKIGCVRYLYFYFLCSFWCFLGMGVIVIVKMLFGQNLAICCFQWGRIVANPFNAFN